MKKLVLATICFVALLFAGCATSAPIQTDLIQQRQLVTSNQQVNGRSLRPSPCDWRVERCLTPLIAYESATNFAIDGIFRRYADSIEHRAGMAAVATLDRFFTVLRDACRQGEESCQDACRRRTEMRRYMDHWNDVASPLFPNVAGETIILVWDPDINPLCESHHNP